MINKMKRKKNKEPEKEEIKITTGLKEQLLMVNADFQNFKKRVEKEKREWINIAQATVIDKFLPFMDDLERALQACNSEKMDAKEIARLKGFEIIQKNFKKVFSELGVKEVDCTKSFNPDFHEALMQVESDKHETGQVVQVLNKGYLFKDKVLRPAKVSVAK